MTFTSAIPSKRSFFSDGYAGHIETRTGVCYCGKVSADEGLFRTGDGRVYFSIRDGWGEVGGVLCGLQQGFLFDFGHATTEETILAECEKSVDSLGTYHSWSEAMAFHAKKEALRKIAEVMGKA